MTRSLVLLTLLLTGLAAHAQGQQAAPPKTIILGFDGMDYALTRRFIEAGDLPNFAKLARQGDFLPLDTSNPAQSPVSWAVFNTGCNPGKTGVAGFVSRTFTPTTARGPGSPLPQSMLGFPDKVSAEPYVPFPLALGNRALFTWLGALAGFVGGFVLLRFVLRFAAVFAFVLGLGAGFGGWWWADAHAASLPADGQLPYVVNPMQGTSFWHYLDARGIRTRGVQVASTYPPDAEGPNTQLLSGLGVPDVSGSPGSWFVYTNDSFSFADKSTVTAGKIIKLYEDEPGRLEARLTGPRNWFEQSARFDVELAELRERRQSDAALSTQALADLDARIATLERDKSAWQRKDNDKTFVPFTMELDKAGHAVTFVVAGQRVRVPQGGWSEFIPVEFRLSERYAAHGLVTFHVLRCDEEETRVFVPPINLDPRFPAPAMPISAPPEFAAQLLEEAGHFYETLGWACITNPLKDWEDSRLTEQSFMDDMVTTEALREDLLNASLDRAEEWDVYFQVFSTPDRICHMMFRETDPDHPAHDAKLAATEVTAFGRSFPLSDAVRQVYMEEDRRLGEVLERVERGEFGEDCLLLIVSDHGFSSFRRQVNLNNVLVDLGYLALKDGLTVDEIFASGAPRDYLQFVDWPNTRAYSLGLGEVYVNLIGREPQGTVPPDEYDALVAEIRAGLLALKDPRDGARVVTSAERRDVLYSGPWWKEGTATRKVQGVPREVTHEGYADIFLGYAPYYRVAWGNTLGGLDTAAITDNDNHWSGDHVSVDPSHVPGVLFSNRPLAEGLRPSLLDIAPTILTRYGIDPAPPNTEMDGTPLRFEASP